MMVEKVFTLLVRSHSPPRNLLSTLVMIVVEQGKFTTSV